MTSITHRTLLVFVAVLGAGAVIVMVLLWPQPREVPPENPAQRTELINATLVEVRELQGADNTGLTPGAITVEVRARVDATAEIVQFSTTDETGDLYQAGQKVRLAQIEQEGLGTTYFISDFRRSTPLIVLVALFIAAVVWFGRLQGLRALVGLALTFVLIVSFMIPALLEGRNPLLIAVVGSVLIMMVTLYLSHGFNAKTTAAVVGTCLALLVTGVLAVLFVGAAAITGFSSDEARMANAQVGGLSLRGLLLAGIIIGGLGVLDDVTMSQSSTVLQLHRANPALRFGQLTQSALAVGRDHIAATVNTLFLAYAGASLPLLILFAGSPDGLGTVVTSETVAIEIIRTLVGSIGLIAAVPLTTALAAGLALGPSAPHREAQETASLSNSTAAIPARDGRDEEEMEWEQRLRQAYRIPPKEEP
jgi:uncharacterized membrane protein